MAKEGVVPSGSVSVNDVPDNQGTTSTATDDKAKVMDQPYLGSWKTREDAEKGLSELQKVMDKQGNEIGSLRKQNQQLFDHITTKAKPGKPDTAPQESPASKELSKVLDDYSKIDFVEDPDAPKKAAQALKQAIALTAQISKEDTLTEANSQFKRLLQEKDMDKVKSKFVDSNPDFKELQSKGVFQALKAKNPLHDDFSAYYAHKADESANKIKELEAQLQEARKIANLAGGDEGTSKVFTKPSGAVREQGSPKPKNLSELKTGALEAIRKARGSL